MKNSSTLSGPAVAPLIDIHRESIDAKSRRQLDLALADRSITHESIRRAMREHGVAVAASTVGLYRRDRVWGSTGRAVA